MAALVPAVPYIIAGFTVVSEIQAGQSAAEMGEAQQAIYDMQAQNTRVIAERNAKIAEDKANYDAARLREQSGQEEAASQRAAKEKRRQTELAISSARAQAGASGASATDPTSLDIYGQIAEQGEYDAMTSLYEGKSASSILRSQAALSEYEGKTSADMIRYGGETDARLLRYQGAVANYEGKVAKQSSYMKAVGTAVGAIGGGIASKYAPSSTTLSSGETIHWNSGRYG